MADNVWLEAALWMGLAAVGAVVSVRLKVPAALVEILLGVLAGNLIAIHSNEWIDFVAGFGSILLTFLAGAEIEPKVLREQLKPALAIGAVSFAAPFAGALLYARFVAHWDPDASKIAGIAMSTTSVAVVYAVMVESGLAKQQFGQLILAACFITDLGTVVALGLLFANYNAWLALFAGASVAALALVPRALPAIFVRWGDRVSEPGIRVLFAILFLLAGLATLAKSEGVLPAYFLGLACAGFMLSHLDVARRVRSTVMSLLTPFYFIKAGTLVSAAQVAVGYALVGAFFAIKMVMKVAGVWPVARAFGYRAREATYTTLMMATGLTFGTISSLYGLTHGYIDQAQYSALVTTVILSAIVPTFIAEAAFPPKENAGEAESGGLEEVEVG